MFEILMYLLENYMESGINFNIDPVTITNELQQIGFGRHEIDRALNWLDGLNQAQQSTYIAPRPQAIRHYAIAESERLGMQGMSFLLYLEQLNILDTMTREIVIDRIMALDSREVDFDRIRWVVLIALFSQPDKKSALTLLQDMILSETLGELH